jgi:murein DD-endopeptidase MepM/ murein hydrolase activator NlpD
MPVTPDPPRAQASPPSATAAGDRPPLTRFTAAVGSDLSESLRQAGVSAVVARDYVALMLKVEHFASEISVADRFDLVVLQFDGEPPVLVYAGMDRVGRADLQFLKYGDEKGRVEWVDARGLERRESGGIALPVGGRITSGFGTRMHPLLHRARFHRGLDLAAAWGTPIRAAADGRVVSAGWHGGYGRQVALAHGGGLDTTYSHMSRILARAGEAVRRGQVIGFVGSSGLSTGPHVHFEARRNGKAIDPRSARIEAPVALSEAQRDAFNSQLRSVLTASGA